VPICCRVLCTCCNTQCTECCTQQPELCALCRRAKIVLCSVLCGVFCELCRGIRTLYYVCCARCPSVSCEQEPSAYTGYSVLCGGAKHVLYTVYWSQDCTVYCVQEPELYFVLSRGAIMQCVLICVLYAEARTILCIVYRNQEYTYCILCTVYKGQGYTV
jgi:hypothetical protein